MSNKILELTEKIYKEGVVKAEIEAGKIIADAKKEAGEIVNSAKYQRLEIIDLAKKQAEEYKKNTNSEIQLAARQFMSNLKHQIINIITAKQVETPVRKAFKDIDFVKNIILTLIENWNPQKPEELNLSILLPKNNEKALSDFFETKAIDVLNHGIEIQFDTKTTNGFKIGPKNGSYKISFADKDFENYFKGYIKERTKKLLFD
ncbi:MAG: hypothetical protein GQ525_16000 [Draconibacterium sp.]|nr:hypothetical protein [Draconibacterium sp.]